MISFFFFHPKVEQMTRRKREVGRILRNALWNNNIHFMPGHFMIEDSGRVNSAFSRCGSIGWSALAAQLIRVPLNIFVPL